MADPDTDKVLRTRIAQDLLDRAGVNTKTILELQPKPMSLFEQAILRSTVEVDEKGNTTPAFEQGKDGRWKPLNPGAVMSGDVVMDLTGLDDEDIVDAEVVDPDYEDEADNERWGREDAQQERLKEIERMKRGTPSPGPDDLNEQRAEQEAEAIRAHARGELGDDDLSQPDRFGVRHDTSAQRAAERRNAEATRRADKTVRSSRSTSTADPYADRYPERSGGRRTISPKRYEGRKKERGGRPD